MQPLELVSAKYIQINPFAYYLYSSLVIIVMGLDRGGGWAGSVCELWVGDGILEVAGASWWGVYGEWVLYQAPVPGTK